MMRFSIACAIVLIGSSASAQQPQQASRTSLGKVASSSAGSAGERQTRSSLGSEAGIEPMTRLNLRIQNRVESRLRNRIDRNYDPQANALSPFQVAGEKARTSNSGLKR